MPVPSEASEGDANSFQHPANKRVVWILRNDCWDADGRAQVRVGTTQLDSLQRTVSRVEVPAASAQVPIAPRPALPMQSVMLSSSAQSFVALE
ncbi:MAG: hypothetical protein ACKO1K_05895 [Burkholderiales bacterium]